MKKCIVSIVCLAIAFTSVAQSDIKIGEWKSHLPYHRISHVESSPEKVYYATNESIMIVDKDESSIDFLTKVQGLSETGIQNLKYDEVNDQLIIAYDNSVFDVVTKTDIFKISDIKNQIDIQGDKSINDMYIQDGRFLYLATGFGVVQFDLENLEFGFTLNISEKVIAIDGSGSNLIIALENGVYTLD